MILINKKIIEKYVNKISTILILLIIITFPINQQIHFRPFPTVDGFIIDYLILKVSLPEVLILCLFVLNSWRIFNSFTRIHFLIFFSFVFILILSIFSSKYKSLSIYENLIWLTVFVNGYLLYKKPELVDAVFLSKSIKIWIIILFVLGFAQFINQGSVFNNYRWTGEFPYSERNLFIKQRGNILTDFMPPMGIFSHANIFGAYILFLLVILNFLKKDAFKYHFCSLGIIILTGSIPVIIAYFSFIFFIRYYRFLNPKFIYILLFFSFLPIFLDSKYFSENFSIFRRVYLLDISENYFLNNPLNLVFGSGYYNYFSIIRGELWNYEIIRFFQPPHNIFILILWNYGLVFLILFIFLLVKTLKTLSKKYLQILFLIIFLGTFDHYLITNHQFRVLYLFIPYSIFYKNDVK